MKIQNKTIIGILQVLFGAGFFGLVPVLVRFAKSVDVLTLVFFRAFFAMLFIWLLIKTTRKPLMSFKEERIQVIIWSLTWIGAVGFYFLSVRLIDIASAVLLLYFQSAFIILFSRYWLKEKIHSITLIALFISITGVVLIVSPMGLNFGGSVLGYLAGLCAALCSGLNFMFPKKYFKNYDIYSLAFYQNLWMLPFLFIFVLLNPPAFTLTNIGIFALLGLVCTAFAFILIYTGLRKVKGQYIGILQTNEVIVAIILGAIIFSEIPSLTVILGGILLITGFLLITIKESKKKRIEQSVV